MPIAQKSVYWAPMVVRMRSTKGHTGNRRSHHAVEVARLSLCACGAYHQRHRACQVCGMYREKQVVDVVARAERTARRTKKHDQTLRSMGMAGNEATETKAETHDHDHAGHDHSHKEEK